MNQMKKLLRRAWHAVARHSRVPLFTRWSRLPDGTFERHCARCEPGWGWPNGIAVVDAPEGCVKKPGGHGYTGPVEFRNGRWQPLRLDA